MNVWQVQGCPIANVHNQLIVNPALVQSWGLDLDLIWFWSWRQQSFHCQNWPQDNSGSLCYNHPVFNLPMQEKPTIMIPKLCHVHVARQEAQLLESWIRYYGTFIWMCARSLLLLQEQFLSIIKALYICVIWIDAVYVPLSIIFV